MLFFCINSSFLQNFLLYEEKDDQDSDISKARKVDTKENKNTIFLNTLNTPIDDKESNDLGIVVSDVTAKWTKSQTDNTLENINLRVSLGRLVAIIGPVGAGKVINFIIC